MNRLKSICFFLLVCLIAQAQTPAITSEYAYRRYTTDDGLPTMFAERLLIDKQGFLWISSVAGLSCFDGLKFNVFMKGKYNKIFHLTEINKDEIISFSKTNFCSLNKIDNTLKNTFYRDSLRLVIGNLVVIPSAYKIFSSPGRKERYFGKLNESNIEKTYHSGLFHLLNGSEGIYFDENERKIYMPVLDSGIYILSGSSPDKLIKIKRPRTVFPYKKEIWCITTFGIYALRHNKMEEVIPCNVDNNEGQIKTITDLDGNLVFHTNNSVFKFSNNHLEKIFESSVINDMVLDREGNVWVATNQGLYCLFRQYFKNYCFKENNDMIRCVVSKNDGKILFASLRGKLGEINPLNGETKFYSYTPNPYDAAFFYSYGCTIKDKIYLPGPGDILQIEKKTSKWLGMPFYDPYLFVNRVNDTLLVAGGPESVTFFTTQDKVTNSYDNFYFGQQIYTKPSVDNEGKIWFGGSQGITIIKNGVIHKKIFEKQLAEIKAMENDMKNQVFIASENRLFKNKGDTVEFIRRFDALITNIYITKSNIPVICTIEGIYVFDSAFKYYSFYNQNNGFTGKEPFEANLTEDESGNVYLPTLEALVTFNPKKLLTKQPQPQLYIQSFFVSQDNIHWQKRDTTNIKLLYSQKNIRFSYIGLSYSQANNVRYQYRLVGFQNQWSQPVAEREVTFNNLPPGRYTFEIKCNAGTPETQTETVSLPIYIKPAFWQTWLFKILMFVLIAGLIAWFAIRYQRKKHRKEMRRANREKEMNELRVQSVRLKSIPHFNSNVLAGIEYFIMTKSKEEANELLTTYSRFTNITLHDIDKAQRSLKDELDYLRMYLGLEKMRYGDKLSYSIDVDGSVKQDVMIPNMALHTYTENAIKHGIRGKNSAGKVQILVKNENKGVRISVEDDGVGRTESAKRNAEQNRTGQGLSILSRQIELYNQQNEEKIEEKAVDLTDENGNALGTRFELYVPYGYKYI